MPRHTRGTSAIAPGLRLEQSNQLSRRFGARPCSSHELSRVQLRVPGRVGRGLRRCIGRPKRQRLIEKQVRLVPIVMTDPLHAERQVIFVASLGHQVEQRVGANQRIEPARVGGVGVEDLAAGRILVEYAQTGTFVAGELLYRVVVVNLAAGLLPGRKRNVIVEVEVARTTRPT